MGSWGRLGPGGEDEGEEDGGGVAGARRFWACQMLHDALQQAARTAGGRSGGGAGDVPADEAVALLVAHRAMLNARGGGLLADLCSQGGHGMDKFRLRFRGGAHA